MFQPCTIKITHENVITEHLLQHLFESVGLLTACQIILQNDLMYLLMLYLHVFTDAVCIPTRMQRSLE